MSRDRTLWISSPASTSLARIDGAGATATSSEAVGITSVTATWVAAYDDKAARRVNTNDAPVRGEVRLGRSPVAVAAGNEVVAVAVQAD